MVAGTIPRGDGARQGGNRNLGAQCNYGLRGGAPPDIVWGLSPAPGPSTRVPLVLLCHQTWGKTLRSKLHGPATIPPPL